MKQYNTLLLCLFVAGTATAQSTPAKPIVSRLEIYDLATGNRRVVWQDSVRFEAPNWTNDGKSLIINEKGLLYKVAVSDGQKTAINTGSATTCNNDHGLTPDGQTIIISANASDPGRTNSTSNVFTLPLAGGEPTRITARGPSYWHGVSPDSKTLAFVGERAVGPDNKPDYDIYSVSIGGGSETRLTTAPGLDDGPDYSPDGKYIYFTSFRTGRMQIWRMQANGSKPEQITNDAYSNWFPHPSPDGRLILFISYLEDQKFAHPADKAVMLRLMDIKKPGQFKELARFTGGQGTINVPCWSPDSKSFAFVSY